MKLYFQERGKDDKLVAEVKDEGEAWEKMQEYLAENMPEFKVYYTRGWRKDGCVYTDFGSHSCFFMLDYNE